MIVRAILLALPAVAVGANEWPMFRGPEANGIADKQNLPDSWDPAKGENIRWKTAIPGLAHSSPIIWGNRIFVTTAMSQRAGATFKPGLYGAGDASPDLSVHQWKLLAVDKNTGKIVWEQVAHEGVPREKRHIKATYANATPATNGRIVVAFFGSQGLYAYTMDGRPVWKKDLGRLNVGAYDAKDYEWGTASSPVLYKDRVIVQCDTQEESFLIGLDLATGKTLWRTAREELPSWGTPNVYRGRTRDEIVTNGSNFIRGYDPDTGQELWRLGGSSKITAPTPVFAPDMIIVASGRRPEAPIFAIRPGASGEITLRAGEERNASVVWRRLQRGSYMPTPLLMGEFLYVLGNAGLFDCYRYQNGEEVYRGRIPHKGSGFSASPVLAGGKIYLSGEDGEMFVVRAGPVFEIVGKIEMGEPIMATPALSDSVLYVRGQHHLFAVGHGFTRPGR